MNEPKALFLTRGDILAWVPGLTLKRWRKIRTTLTEIYVPGGRRPAYAGQRPMYAKAEVRAKLVAPLLQ